MAAHGTEPVTLAEVRARLARTHGRLYWRSLEELAETKEFKEMLHREFPDGASEWWEGLSRRNFLKLAAASLAVAGLTACTKQPTREIYPYVKQPAELVLGEPLYYATSMLLGGFATGVLAKSREGHPIKVDGNPEHPAGARGSSVWMQASILDLYDPDRSQTVTHNGEISSWASFLAALNELVSAHQANKGQGLRFLTGTVTSPTLAAQLQDLLQRFPNARWHQYEAISRDNVRAGAAMAFGSIAEAHYRFDKAAVILALDSDFLYTHPARLLYARQFTDGRRISAGKREANRLYVVESSPTVTGTMAEHRLPLANQHVAILARAVAGELGLETQAGAPQLGKEHQPFVAAVARDLQKHRGAGIVIAGEYQPPAVHALAHLINERLGNVDQTVSYAEPAEAEPVDQLQSIRELTSDMHRGAVQTLFVLGGNPAFTAPSELSFGMALDKVRASIHLGLEQDETAALCTWHIPEAHYLESWGDARAFDGTVSMLQPLIAPLYDGKTEYEVLGAMVRQQPVRSDYEIVRAFWEKQKLWADFEKGWRKTLHDGFIPNSRAAAKKVQVKADPNQLIAQLKSKEDPSSTVPTSPASGNESSNTSDFPAPIGRKHPGELGPPQLLEKGLEISFRPDPQIWDGRFANNGWLQECPKPVNKLTWDNAALVSPRLAERLRLSTNEVVELSLEGRTLEAPVWIMPGQAENTITLHLGYGRGRAGRVGSGIGFNAYLLRTSRRFWSGQDASISRTRRRHQLVATQTHHLVEGADREIYRATTLKDFLARPGLIKSTLEEPEKDETLYYPDEYKYEGYKWGMSIDLGTCIGCNACVVACEVENNIPVVGKDQVYRNREMLWLRVDTYYEGSLENPTFNHMPVPCMHCEHAPCELVCPVAATVHDHEGLNLQVYNRCVGTRFCSNNCPYKVRRFNFLRYTNYDLPNYKPMYNPEVTVRWRGVMEKCTYCIQRISSARITAEKENRRIREGEVTTACQDACPVDAIVFGDLNAPDSRVAKLKRQPLGYSMLGQLNTRPRTTYLAKVQNPNPEIGPVPAERESKSA